MPPNRLAEELRIEANHLEQFPPSPSPFAQDWTNPAVYLREAASELDRLAALRAAVLELCESWEREDESVRWATELRALLPEKGSDDGV